MNISALKNENFGQYLGLLTNPLFLNAIKSVAKSSDNSGKYDALFENLEKLSSLISQGDETGSASGVQAQPGSASVANPSSSVSAADARANELINAMRANQLENQALGDIIDDIIANADLLESMLDLEMIPPGEEVADLLKKFRDIIARLDKDTRENIKNSKDKETESVYKLLPSSSSKSGFLEGLILLAK